MNFVTTKVAARILGVSISCLHQAAWLEKFPPPEKVNGGYVWTLEDLRRAYRVLHGKPFDFATVPSELKNVVDALNVQPNVTI